jgi:hypothetical protein
MKASNIYFSTSRRLRVVLVPYAKTAGLRRASLNINDLFRSVVRCESNDLETLLSSSSSILSTHDSSANTPVELLGLK